MTAPDLSGFSPLFEERAVLFKLFSELHSQPLCLSHRKERRFPNCLLIQVQDMPDCLAPTMHLADFSPLVKRSDPPRKRCHQRRRESLVLREVVEQVAILKAAHL